MNLADFNGLLAGIGGLMGLVALAYMGAMLHLKNKQNKLLMEGFHSLEVKLSFIDGMLRGSNKK